MMFKTAQSKIILLLSIITICAVITTIVVLLRNSGKDEIPEFAPQKVDENAEKMDDGDDEKMETEDGGGAVSLTYQKKVEIQLAENLINLMFQNPQKSTKDMVLQLFITDGDQKVMIAQSELLPPGYRLKEMTLLNTAKLSLGEHKGMFIVQYYDGETGEKAIVNTEASVDITVK